MQKQSFEIIFIMLGDACNFECKYCMQGQHKEKVIQPVLSPKLLSYLDDYPNKQNTYLCFWGGEPLLYFPVIKQIVERYRSDFLYEMVSNGSLLTQEIVDFLNRHNVRFHLSHDGQVTEETRGIDVLKNERISDLFERIRERSVNVTFSSVTPALSEVFQYYPNDLFFTVNTMINTTDTDISRRYADFDAEKYKADIMYLLKSYEEYVRGDSTKWREYNNVCYLINSVKIFLREGMNRNRCYDCGRGKKMLNLDCEGNLFLCHNSKIKIGTVEDDYDVVAQKMDKLLAKSREKCGTCDFQKVCGGNCVLLCEEGRKQHCRTSKLFYSIFIPWMLKTAQNLGGERIE